MSAGMLRETAALIRKRAKAATPGPWTNTHLVLRRGGLGLAVTQHPLDGGKFVMCDPQSDARREDAEHIASWHPDVALAVADWLERVAADVDQLEADFPAAAPIEVEPEALAVARAYLGRDS